MGGAARAGTERRRRAVWLAGLVLALTLALAACEAAKEAVGDLERSPGGEVEATDVEAPQVETPVEGTPGVETPEVEAPGGAGPPAEEEGIPAWVWVAVGVGAALLLLIIVGVWRSRSRAKQRTGRAVAVWRDRARSTYGKAQSVRTEATAELCARMGDAGFRRDVLREEPMLEDRSALERWSGLERMEREVTSELFTLEAGSPLPDWPEIVRAVIDAVGTLKRATETCSTAQFRLRQAEQASHVDAGEASRRRADAETILHDSREALEAALSSFRSIL